MGNLVDDFPVLSAGPTPHAPLEEWDFSIVGEVDEPRQWTWEEFRTLPSEEITTDIHCVTKWSKLGTRWEGVTEIPGASSATGGTSVVAMQPHRRILWRRAEVVEVVSETPRTKSLVLEVSGQEGHKAGQHVDIRLTAEEGYQAQRSYSIASAPENERLGLTVDSSRSLAEIIYREELKKLDARDGSLEVIHTLTRSRPEGWNGYARRIDAEMLEEVGPPLEERPLTFVCGPAPLVAAAALVALRHDPARVKTERFGPTGG